MLTTQPSQATHHAARYESTTKIQTASEEFCGSTALTPLYYYFTFLSPGATSACVISGVRKGRRCSAARWESLDPPIRIINWEPPLAVTILGNQYNRSDNFHSIISARHRRPSAIQRCSPREGLLEHSFRGTSNRLDRSTIHVMTQASIASPVQLTSCTTSRHDSPCRTGDQLRLHCSNTFSPTSTVSPLQQYIISRPITVMV